jgi:hypothetical protein
LLITAESNARIILWRPKIGNDCETRLVMPSALGYAFSTLIGATWVLVASGAQSRLGKWDVTSSSQVT